MNRKIGITTPTQKRRFSGSLNICASYQVQRWQIVMCSETRPNGKPENRYCSPNKSATSLTQLEILPSEVKSQFSELPFKFSFCRKPAQN
jgi:hypothetical protein